VGHDSQASLALDKAAGDRQRKLSLGSMGGMWSLLRSVRKVADRKVRTHSVFPKGVEGTDLTFEVLRGFLGKDPLAHLNALKYGNENLELTGLQYWQHR
jgi:hypothetical protein